MYLACQLLINLVVGYGMIRLHSIILLIEVLDRFWLVQLRLQPKKLFPILADSRLDIFCLLEGKLRCILMRHAHLHPLFLARVFLFGSLLLLPLQLALELEDLLLQFALFEVDLHYHCA